jgi:hypothetical protein
MKSGPLQEKNVFPGKDVLGGRTVREIAVIWEVTTR